MLLDDHEVQQHVREGAHGPEVTLSNNMCHPAAPLCARRVGRSREVGVPNSPQLLQGQDRRVEDLLLCIERRTESVVSIRHHSARCVVTSDVEFCWIVIPNSDDCDAV